MKKYQRIVFFCMLAVAGCAVAAEEKEGKMPSSEQQLQAMLKPEEIEAPLLAEKEREEEKPPEEEDAIADRGGQNRQDLDRKPNLWDKNQQRLLNNRVRRTHDGTYPETRVSNSN